MLNPDTPDIEELQRRALIAIDEIKYCVEQMAVCMGVATLYDEASAALENVIERVDDLPLDLENICDDAMGDDDAK